MIEQCRRGFLGHRWIFYRQEQWYSEGDAYSLCCIMKCERCSTAKHYGDIHIYEKKTQSLPELVFQEMGEV